MPALLERPAPVSVAPAIAEVTATPAIPPVRTCSGCFLTEQGLRETGVFGCARCYETFAPQVALAAEKLHGVRVPDGWVESANAPVRHPRSPHSVTNPWPTRRAVPRVAP